MPFSTSHLDPVSVAIALASVIFGPALAGVIGPYAVIFMGSTVGAAWSLGRRQPGAKLGAVWYFARINTTALLVTVSVANIAAGWIGAQDSHWMLAPIALFVGVIGDDWPRVASWLLVRAGRVIERRTGSAGSDGGNAP